jgi:actin-related protein
MVVESPSVPAQDRAKLAEMLFETLRVTSVCFANSAALSLLASGRVSGLSVETGAGVTHVCPVFQGLVLTHAQKRIEIGGQDISSAVCQALRQNGVQIEVCCEKAARRMT